MIIFLNLLYILPTTVNFGHYLFLIFPKFVRNAANTIVGADLATFLGGNLQMSRFTPL